MNEIVINNLAFKPYLSADEIAIQVKRIANEIELDCAKHIDSPTIFICVLNGAFIFASDLFRAYSAPAEIEFIKVSSYVGTSSTGTVKQILGLNTDITARNIVIIEDIVDTGRSASEIVEYLKKLNPASIRFATLFYKPEASVTGFTPDYIGFNIPTDFIVGYGLDYDGLGRNIPEVLIKG
ncbi:MAG: hypoxanthine phosphoribosyltransferase [Bacteroidales bacterium]